MESSAGQLTSASHPLRSRSLYGCRIEADFLLSELESTTDCSVGLPVRVYASDVELPPADLRDERRGSVRATPRETLIYWPKLGAVRVRDGREIAYRLLPGADFALLRAGIFGEAFAPLLAQRGVLPLHGSVVEAARWSGAIAFVGAVGSGKSTMAAALLELGAAPSGVTLIADDVCALDLASTTPRVQRGAPRIKLLPDASSGLGHDSAALLALPAEEGKRALPAPRVATAGTPASPPVLRCLYLLEEADCEEIVPLPAQRAVMELLRHTYNAPLVQGTLGAQGHLEAALAVVRGVQVAVLRRRRDLGRLRDVAHAIDQQAARAIKPAG